jgi:hypothetical protein
MRFMPQRTPSASTSPRRRPASSSPAPLDLPHDRLFAIRSVSMPALLNSEKGLFLLSPRGQFPCCAKGGAVRVLDRRLCGRGLSPRLQGAGVTFTGVNKPTNFSRRGDRSVDVSFPLEPRRWLGDGATERDGPAMKAALSPAHLSLASNSQSPSADAPTFCSPHPQPLRMASGREAGAIADEPFGVCGAILPVLAANARAAPRSEQVRCPPRARARHGSSSLPGS